MSLFGRLFGAKPPPPPPPNTITVDADIASRLTADGATLQDAVNQTVRAYLEAQQRAAEAAEKSKQLEGIPFWLRRDAGGGGEIDEELRDRVIQRQTAGEEGERG